MKRAQLQADPEIAAKRRLARTGGRLISHHREVMVAWERFVSGENIVKGVPAEVLLSWRRCRDVHNVDPYLVSPPRARGSNRSLAYNTVFAQLGGIAAMIVERNENCLATVTDGDGQILASWGSGAASRKAAESNLAPFFSWSESTTGTNGMGTALTQISPMLVRGPEHWCQALHGWSCLGMGVYDLVTREAVAALNVSSWESAIPISAHQITSEMRAVYDGLRRRAWRDGVEVADVFAETSRNARGALLAVDAAGNVIAANDMVRASMDRLSASLALDPAKRYPGDRLGLAEVARRSVQRAQAEPQWVGSADLSFLLGGSNHLFEIRPVLSPEGVIGLILADEGAANGEAISTQAQASSAPAISSRIVGMRNGRMLLRAAVKVVLAVQAVFDGGPALLACGAFPCSRGRARGHGSDSGYCPCAVRCLAVPGP